MTTKTIVFLGGGNMASAMMGGLVAQGTAPETLIAIDLEASARERARSQGHTAYDTLEKVDWATVDALVLAVKPQQMRAAVSPLAGKLRERLVISIAAGLRIADLSRWMGGHRAIVRAMPNTPALIGKGICGAVAAPNVSAIQRGVADEVLKATGDVEWFDTEGMLDSVTALSGSGPAYVFYFLEAMQKVGIEMGFSEDSARKFAQRTFEGATALAQQSAEPLSLLRERVTSKGGTTAAALAVMNLQKVDQHIVEALHAARLRSEELGEIMGRD